MIYLSTSTIIEWENSYGFIEASSGKLTTVWRKIDIKNSLQVILVDHFRFVQFPHVKGVAI